MGRVCALFGGGFPFRSVRLENRTDRNKQGIVPLLLPLLLMLVLMPLDVYACWGERVGGGRGGEGSVEPRACLSFFVPSARRSHRCRVFRSNLRLSSFLLCFVLWFACNEGYEG